MQTDLFCVSPFYLDAEIIFLYHQNMKHFFVTLFLLVIMPVFFFASSPSPAVTTEKTSVFILDYHTFLGNNNKSQYDFSPEELLDHLKTFEKLGFIWVSLDDAIAGNLTGKNNLVMTIDDGNHSVPAVVKNILMPRGIVATLFVSAKCVLDDKFVLNPMVLKEMDALGCIIGAHGYQHSFVTRSAFAENPEKALMEIEKPAPILQEILGKKILYFAYPYGVIQREKEPLVAKAGYTYGFSAGFNLEAVDFKSPALNRYDVPRFIVSKRNIAELYAKLAVFAMATKGKI